MRGFAYLMLGFSLVLFFPGRLPGEEPPVVVINEVAWAGSSKSSLDEWIELYNPTAEEENLSDWQISINSLEITLPIDSLIPAGGFYLIAKYKETNPKSILNVTVELDREGKQFSLPNSGFTIQLKNSSGATIDTAWDGSEPTVGGKKGELWISMERRDPSLPGSQKESWQEALTAVNFDEGSQIANRGTPKAPNSTPAPAPQIASISPTEAVADSLFELEEINGQNFSVDPKPQVELIKDSSIFTAQEVQSVTATLMAGVRFDLTDAEAGIYSLIVRNPDGQEGLLADALTLQEKEIFDNTDGIIVSELLPKPSTGSDNEFIELHNTLSRPVNLKGWQIDDNEGGSSPFQIENLTIPAFGYLAFYKSETKIALNDTGDIGRAIKPDNSESHRTVSYDRAKEGWAWALFGSEFKWTKTPTPGGANTLVVDEERVELTLEVDEIKATSVTLNWTLTSQDKISGLSLWQQGSLSSTPTKLADLSLSASSFEVDGLSPATTYYFKLKAILKEGGEKESPLTQATTLSEASTPPSPPTEPADFAINEILPRPAGGGDEFIEIINLGGEPADLTGYQLKDASGRTFKIGATISSSALLNPSDLALFPKSTTGIYLNDQGPEEVWLLSPSGQLLSRLVYDGAAPRGYSLARGFDGQYYWTSQPTPGENNLIITAEMLASSEEETAWSGVSSPSGEQNQPLPSTGAPLGWINIFLSLFLLWRIKHYESRNQESG